MQGRKAPPTPTSTPQPRAPPADLAGDVAGGSSEVGSQPSHGGRPMVGCLGGLFCVTSSDRKRSRTDRCYLFEMFGDFGGDFGVFGDFGGAMGGAMGGAVDGAAARVGVRGVRRSGVACGDGVAHGRRRAAGARPSRAHRAGRAALARVAAHALYACHFVCVYFRACPWPAAVGRIDVLRRPHDHRASCLHSAAVYVLVRIKSVARAADSHANL